MSRDDLLLAVVGERRLPERSIILTFDDGLKEHVEIAWSILKEMGIPGLFFVNTQPTSDGTISLVHQIHLLRSKLPWRDFLELVESTAAEAGAGPLEVQQQDPENYRYDDREVANLKFLLNIALERPVTESLIGRCFEQVFRGNERRISQDFYMSQLDIRALADAGCIGSHGHRHLPLGVVPHDIAREDVKNSVDRLSEWTGALPTAFSYPYGSKQTCTVEVGAILADLGFAFSFTMERAVNIRLDRRFHLARFDTNDIKGGKDTGNSLRDPFLAAPASWFDDGE